MSDTPGGGRFAVTGHPINHSLSPLIHAQFAADCSIAMSYDLLPAPIDGFESVVSEFFHQGGAGLNVTLPFKEQAAELVDYCDPAAALAGAVNTIRRDSDGRLAGFNTDGIGLVEDLLGNLQWSISGRRVLLIGAGGASRGALDALLNGAARSDSTPESGGPAELVLANRTLQKAQQLVRDVAPDDARVRVCAPAAVTGSFDLVINATSASLAGRGALVPTEAVRGARCYDMLYAEQQTVFAGWASSHGAAEVADGLGMLLEQAAAAFAIWHGVRPATRELSARREQLFVAQRAGAESLVADMAEETAAETAEETAGGPVKVAKRRFIAGAVCPECREIDRLVVQDTGDGGREQVCIACGFQQPAPGGNANSMVPRGKPERASANQTEVTQPQAVRFVDPVSPTRSVNPKAVKGPKNRPEKDAGKPD